MCASLFIVSFGPDMTRDPLWCLTLDFEQENIKAQAPTALVLLPSTMGKPPGERDKPNYE